MKYIFLTILTGCALFATAQNDRVNDFNNTNWVQGFITVPINKKWSAHGEYQWRRTDGFKNWQQSLLRAGVNYKMSENASIGTGYAYVLTYPYGDYPIASNGTFPEHRLYEQLVLKQPLNKWLITHRFRIEQRWLGKIKAGSEGEIESWQFLHRFRYQAKAQYSFTSKCYAAFADELFIGAGKNVGINIFDQNRIFLLAGYKVNTHYTIEAGYFNQTLQQGRKINNATIMQHNNGIVLSNFITL